MNIIDLLEALQHIAAEHHSKEIKVLVTVKGKERILSLQRVMFVQNDRILLEAKEDDRVC